MKKIAMFAAIAAVSMLASCNSNKNAENTTDSVAVEEVVAAPVEETTVDTAAMPVDTVAVAPAEEPAKEEKK